METALPLSEKLYLLGIHPERGGIVSGSYTAMDYVLLGSLFMELYLQNKIRIEQKHISVLSLKTDNELHRFLLEKMSRSEKPRRISYWINKLYFSLKHIRGEVRQSLAKKRLIRLAEKRFLFFRWKKPVISNPMVVTKLVHEVQDLVMKGTRDERELILLSFIVPCGLHNRLFSTREKRKEAKRRLKEMMASNAVSAAVQDAISAANAVAASVAATTAATAGTH